jgi:hypothetical protein
LVNVARCNLRSMAIPASMAATVTVSALDSVSRPIVIRRAIVLADRVVPAVLKKDRYEAYLSVRHKPEALDEKVDKGADFGGRVAGAGKECENSINKRRRLIEFDLNQ